ncbi:MAG: hypothetical protein H6728_00930 [Myxococcales bacterium]|nr:hypothetical protein [Myxococcales bacterium]
MTDIPNPQDFFPALRQLLSQPPSAKIWRLLRRLFDAWPGGDEKLMGLEYAEQHLRSWDPHLCIVYVPYATSDMWSLARTLDISNKRDPKYVVESLTELNTLAQFDGLKLRFDDWRALDLEHRRKFRSLRSLTLTHCNQHTHLDIPTAELPHLESLALEKCDRVQSIVGIAQYKHIHSFRAARLMSLREASFLQHLPNLRKLTLKTLSDLRNLNALSSLTSLEDLHLNDLQRIRGIEPLQTLVNLKALFLSDGKYFPDLDALGALKQLEELEIRGGQSLASFDFERQLPKLQKLIVRCCPRLKEKTLQHKTLTQFYISHLDALYKVRLEELPTLERLSIRGALQLDPDDIYLQEIPPSLAHLYLRAKGTTVDLNRHSEVQSYLQTFQSTQTAKSRTP